MADSRQLSGNSNGHAQFMLLDIHRGTWSQGARCMGCMEWFPDLDAAKRHSKRRHYWPSR